MRWIYIMCAVGLGFAQTLSAEVVTDGSLGQQVSLSGPDYQITADLGQQYDSNLFHSFSQLNLLSTESATFSGPDSVRYIIARVTGGSSSLIEGLLKSTIPGSQLWLFNSAGMNVLGPVEVPGGVRATEAIGLRLKDGGLFSADLNTESTLTVAAPQTFFFASEPSFDSDPIRHLPERPEHEQPLHINPAVAERRHNLDFQPQGCSVQRERSHFFVRRYRGTRSSPDDWQSSHLMPLGFETAPTQSAPRKQLSQNVVCNDRECAVRYQYH